MSLETDSDRLISIRALGGICIEVKAGFFWAIFDREASATTIGDATIVTQGPSIQARSSDVERLRITRNADIDIQGTAYKVVQIRPDGTGMTILGLEEA